MRAAERERGERDGSDLDSDGEWVEELCLDVLGRVVAPAGVAELSTACASSVGALVRAHDDRVAAALCRDCEEVYCGESFWIHAGARPRNSLERLALAVFRGHAGTSEAARSPGCGAEWWVQVRGGKGGAQLGTGEAIGMHWDKDEDLVDTQGLIVTPRVSTVTYLTDSGAPTVVLERETPIASGGDTIPDGTAGGAPLYGPISRASVSYPVRGKHFSFDGRWLHGALASLRAEDGGRRLTFLTNVWLGHKPVGIEELDQAVSDTLSDMPEEQLLEEAARTRARGGEGGEGPQARAAATNGKAGSGHSDGDGRFLRLAAEVPLRLGVRRDCEACGELESESHTFGPSGVEHTLTIPVPTEACLAWRAAGHHSIAIAFGRGATATLEKGVAAGPGGEGGAARRGEPEPDGSGAAPRTKRRRRRR